MNYFTKSDFPVLFALKPKMSLLPINARGKKGVVFRVMENTRMIRDCRNTFLGILNLKKDRVQRIVKQRENVSNENRGGIELVSKMKRRSAEYLIS